MSEFNRRDLLKYFGIGATIVPLVGGTPELRAPARLIETPNLEPVQVPEVRVQITEERLPPYSLLSSVFEVDVTMEFLAPYGHYNAGDRLRIRPDRYPNPWQTIDPQRRYRFKARSVIVNNYFPEETFALADHYNSRRNRVPGPLETSWTISGTVVGPASLEVDAPLR